MSKLRDKFNPLLENRIYNHEIVVDKLEQITDDFSVKFAEWLLDFKYNKAHELIELQQYFKENIYGKE